MSLIHLSVHPQEGGGGAGEREMDERKEGKRIEGRKRAKGLSEPRKSRGERKN